MSKIGQQLVQAVRDVVADNPLHVYQGACYYVQDGCPSCLLGHALWNLGLIDASLASSIVNEEGIDKFLSYRGVEVDNLELMWLETVQEAQDNGVMWQTAVRIADEAVYERQWEFE